MRRRPAPCAFAVLLMSMPAPASLRAAQSDGEKLLPVAGTAVHYLTTEEEIALLATTLREPAGRNP